MTGGWAPAGLLGGFERCIRARDGSGKIAKIACRSPLLTPAPPPPYLPLPCFCDLSVKVMSLVPGGWNMMAQQVVRSVRRVGFVLSTSGRYARRFSGGASETGRLAPGAPPVFPTNPPSPVEVGKENPLDARPASRVSPVGAARKFLSPAALKAHQEREASLMTDHSKPLPWPLHKASMALGMPPPAPVRYVGRRPCLRD
jgi:hypothetical protein